MLRTRRRRTQLMHGGQKMKPDWNLIGPWLGNRRIEKEIGYPVYNDPMTSWLINPGVAFLTYRVEGYIDCLYVEPAHRLQGLATDLVWQVIARLCQCPIVRVSANANSRPMFLKMGFVITSGTKNFTRMERVNA